MRNTLQRRRFLFDMMRRRRTLFLTATLSVLFANSSWAENVNVGAIVKDGNTLSLGDTTYRLDGIDAPEFDQMCIDQKADPWSCGIEARDRLTKFVGDRAVNCEDKGLDPTFKSRHVGVCTVDGETGSLNQWLVREGWALNFEPSAAGRFKADETAARESQKGLWLGCFTAPQDFQHGKKDAALLGASCRSDKDAEMRAILFPSDPAMPPNCAIKGKFALRAKFTGNVGVYQMQSCRNYASLTRPDRWFCSEEDAKAAGFRKAYNCGNLRRRPDQ
jgi:endonuclease YncB( thermonuclease family)